MVSGQKFQRVVSTVEYSEIYVVVLRAVHANSAAAAASCNLCEPGSSEEYA